MYLYSTISYRHAAQSASQMDEQQCKNKKMIEWGRREGQKQERVGDRQEGEIVDVENEMGSWKKR